jgi:uncharacterized protein GlcG (DUF336 family)
MQPGLYQKSSAGNCIRQRLIKPRRFRAIHAAVAKAHNLAVNISVTVCDAYGRLILAVVAPERPDTVRVLRELR